MLAEIVGLALLGWGAAALGAGAKVAVDEFKEDPEGFKQELKDLARTAPSMVANAAGATVKEAVNSKLQASVAEMDKNKYIAEEPKDKYEIVSSLIDGLEGNGYGKAYTNYDLRQIYGALSAAYELELLSDDYDFFSLLSSHGYNIEEFIS